MFLPILVDLRGAVDDGEVRLEALEVRLAVGTDEHVGDEVLLPRHLVNEADPLLTLGVGPAEAIEDVGLLLRVEVLHGLLVELVKDLGRRGLVDLAPVDVLVGLAANVLHEPLVARRTPCELAGVDAEGVAVLGRGNLALVVADLVLEELLEGLILVDGRGAGDAQAGNAGFLAGSGAGVDVGGVVSSADGILFGRKGGFVRNLLLPLGVAGRANDLKNCW